MQHASTLRSSLSHREPYNTPVPFDLSVVSGGSAKQANAAAGQQESKVESLESIHAARLRSGSEAGTSAPQTGSSAAALTAKSQSASDSESDDQAVFGNGGLGEADAETDPYSLPVSHEVALEGVYACTCVHVCVPAHLSF